MCNRVETMAIEYGYGIRFKKERKPSQDEDALVREYLTDELKGWCKNALESFSFVKWDRFICSKPPNGPHSIVCYGWIDRDTDAYKDFVLIGLVLDTKRAIYVSSSSLKYNDEIGKLCTVLSNEKAPTYTKKCIRIEDWLEVSNAIKLHGKK